MQAGTTEYRYLDLWTGCTRISQKFQKNHEYFDDRMIFRFIVMA